MRIRQKSLGGFVKRLEERGLVRVGERQSGRGGSRVTFSLAPKGVELSETQLRRLLEQSETGFPLTELPPLADVVEKLEEGHADRMGRFGEMLAVHLCLMLGLTVRSWRKRAPQAEIDLIAERRAALTYQRWAVQVKNTGGDLDSDRIDREIGAAAGTGTTHILFVVPRAGLTDPARREIAVRSALTPLHVYVLCREDVGEKAGDALLARLRRQEAVLAVAKRRESERREGTYGV